jgi:hypothetical protein
MVRFATCMDPNSIFCQQMESFIIIYGVHDNQHLLTLNYFRLANSSNYPSFLWIVWTMSTITCDAYFLWVIKQGILSLNHIFNIVDLGQYCAKSYIMQHKPMTNIDWQHDQNLLWAALPKFHNLKDRL